MTENTNPPEGSLDWRLSAYELSWKFACWKVTTFFHQNSGRSKHGASLCLLSCFFFPSEWPTSVMSTQTDTQSNWLTESRHFLPPALCQSALHTHTHTHTHTHGAEWDKKEAMIFILITRPATSSSAWSPSLLITPSVTAIAFPHAVFVFMSA